VWVVVKVQLHNSCEGAMPNPFFYIFSGWLQSSNHQFWTESIVCHFLGSTSCMSSQFFKLDQTLIVNPPNYGFCKLFNQVQESAAHLLVQCNFSTVNQSCRQIALAFSCQNRPLISFRVFHRQQRQILSASPSIKIPFLSAKRILKRISRRQ
jgi:hypothetical protein